MYQLVLPPSVWQAGFRQLALSGQRGVARLARSHTDQKLQLIAQPLLSHLPVARGSRFGPLDDLLVVEVRSSVRSTDAIRLMRSFHPAHGQIVVALVLGVGPAAGRWDGRVYNRGKLSPLAGLRMVGPGMHEFSRRRASREIADQARWSRTRGALGESAWQRVRSSRVAVVGASRNGSVAATAFAMLGVRETLLIDPGREEIHHLDATLWSTPEGVGRAKVENRAAALERIRPDDLVVKTSSKCGTSHKAALRIWLVGQTVQFPLAGKNQPADGPTRSPKRHTVSSATAG